MEVCIWKDTDIGDVLVEVAEVLWEEHRDLVANTLTAMKDAVGHPLSPGEIARASYKMGVGDTIVATATGDLKIQLVPK